MLPVFNKRNFKPIDWANYLDVSRHTSLKFADDQKPTLGNPFVPNEYGGKDGDREQVVQKYAFKLEKDLQREGFKKWLLENVNNKKGLLCYCEPALCHAHVIRSVIHALEIEKDPLIILKKFQQDPLKAHQQVLNYIKKENQNSVNSIKPKV